MALVFEDLSGSVIGAAIEVHRVLGPGLLESVYETCLCKELSNRGILHRRQVRIPVIYKGEPLDHEFIMDIVFDEKICLELKTVDRLEPIHQAQLLTYLKLSGLKLGLLLNFNVPVLTQGLKRMVL